MLVRLSVLLGAEGCYGTDDRHAHHKYSIVGVGAMISCLTPVGLKHVQLNLQLFEPRIRPTVIMALWVPVFYYYPTPVSSNASQPLFSKGGRREGKEKGEGRKRKRREREGTGLASSFFNFWLWALSSLSCRPQSESVRYSGHAATYLIVKGQTVT